MTIMNNQESTAAPSSGFVPPRHWVGVEELSSNYWNDAETQTRRGQEFHDKPVETISMIERMDSQGIARRDFLTIMGASMAMATLSCARRPVHKIIPYVIAPEEIVPGVANMYATTCPETGYGILAKTREGRPIKLEGNPEHPINRGKLSARGQASLLDLYDPDRLQEPKAGARNGARNMTWAEIDAAIGPKLKAAGKVRLLTGAMLSDSTRRLAQEFLGGFGNGAHVEFDPLSQDEVFVSQQQSYGAGVFPTYRLDQVDTLLALSSDILSTGRFSVQYQQDFAARRTVSNQEASQAKLSKFYAFESTMTNTGAAADERYPIRPGDELKIALAIAHELVLGQKRSRYAGDSNVSGLLSGYAPGAVASEFGWKGGEEKIREIAEALWNSRGKSLVVAGSVHARSALAVELQVAVNFLNSALENEGTTVDGNFNPSTLTAAGFTGLQKLIQEMSAGQVDVLIVQGVNPAYLLPATSGFREAMAKVPLKIVIADREDETALLADYTLPDSHFLESWGDAHPRKLIYSMQQPTIAPIHNSRSLQENLLAWIRGASLKTSGLAAKITAAPAESGTWHDYLMAQWKETLFREASTGASFDTFWEGVLRDGTFDMQGAHALSPKSAARAFRVSALASLPKYQPRAGEMFLALYETTAMADGRNANNPWLLEMPDPISSITWDNYLNLGPEAAKKLDLDLHDVAEIKVGDQTFELAVNVQPGLHPSAASAAIGFGRQAAGKVGVGAGVDVNPAIQVAGDRLVYSGMPITIRKTGKFFKLAQTQWHTVSENRPILNDVTLAEYRKNPAVTMETNPELKLETVPSIWPAYEYKGYRWGMAIDLSSCTGCGACVIGCQAENNIPVVGRENVRVSRQMHWIRIDRYYSGTPDQPDMIFQPMLCQHCENAPCETVCPVLATVHNDEGLNEQVYNRCVGTRYCQNNCPYKVRRFNFFDHWKSYEGPMNMVWNPDVTVRTRGIMEKCTFCVQRIRSAKDHAKDMSSDGVARLVDGDVKTACQQTCPTNAIVFGDVNDPNSRVSKLRAQPSAFRVLEIINTKPMISYLTKVRNKVASAEGAESPHSRTSNEGETSRASNVGGAAEPAEATGKGH